MITVLGQARRACSGPTRRETLKVGALSLLGGCLNLPSLVAMEQRGQVDPRQATAQSVLLLYLQGGAPTQDMYDMKPDAPVEVRSDFQPVASTAPGIDVCELLPLTAQWMHKTAVVRSVYHNGPCHNNQPMYTGRDEGLTDEDARASDPPSMGSVIAWHDAQQGRPQRVPPYVFVPCALGWGEGRVKGGPHGGFLGRNYDAFATTCKAHVAQPPDDDWNPQTVLGEPLLSDLELKAGITLDRLAHRGRLRQQFDTQLRAREADRQLDQLNVQQRLAYELLTSQAIRRAFDFHQEPESVRDRYGRTLFGTSALLGRRLIQAGSRFVNVSYDNLRMLGVNKASWDTHKNNFPMLKKTLLPDFDRTFSALIEDLDGNGLLDETLVVVMGEMGRTPKINADGGRDHWTHCYSVLFAGGGIRGGVVCGESDDSAAWIKDRPVHIRDVCATIYHVLGFDPEMLVYDRAQRPTPIARGGKVITEILV